MKQLHFGILLLFLSTPLLNLKAQQNHYIYIQTENKQPFYVKLDTKQYNSAASGYLVVPKLKDGVYNLMIGFPKSEWTEQKITCTINNNDAGFLLKNFGDKGWGLFNFQTLEVAMANEGAKPNNVEVVNKTDAFSNMLSNVVNDSTIRQTEIVKEDVKNTAPKQDDTALLKAPVTEGPSKEKLKTSEVNEVKADVNKEKATIATDQVATVNDARSAITRSLFNKNADGTEMVFIDELDGKKDTVRVFIPADKNQIPVEEKPKAEPAPSQPAKEEVKLKDSRFLEIEIPNANKKPEEKKEAANKEISKAETPIKEDKPIEPVNNKTAMINSDCKSVASDEDFLKLRKKMAAQGNDDDMGSLAKKSFKSKCFTVEQVKNLSVLFLKDPGKYAFFDLAYPFVSDSQNFSSLQSQLSETYYINRFQVMIRH